MIKKIKIYWKLRKAKREIQIEIIETLATICLYLAYNRDSRNPQTPHLHSHFAALKNYSYILRNCDQKNAFIYKHGEGEQ